MPICWFLRAVPDNREVTIRSIASGGMSFMFTGTADVGPFVNVAGVRRDILLPTRLPKETPTVIFNEISSPETHTQGLEICAKIVAKIGCPVLNTPEKIQLTRRHHVAEALRGIPGLRVPRVICCLPKSPAHVLKLANEAGIEPPLLVREAGIHDAEGLTKIDQRSDRRLLHHFAFDGRNYYVSEFLETRSADGLYRKARIMMVDGKPFLRHLLTSEDWIINTPQRCDFESYPERMAEEQQAYAAFPGPLATTLDAIDDVMGLDYYGIDCHIGPDGVISLFEANANMTALFNMRQDVVGQDRVLQPILRTLETMIQNAQR